MAKTEIPPPQDEAPAAEWIKRLDAIVTAIEAMGSRERMAALVYLKSKYRDHWPSDNY